MKKESKSHAAGVAATELLGAIFETASKTKKDLFRGLSHDAIKQIVDKIDPMAFLTEFLSKNQVELKVTIGVKPRDPARKSKLDFKSKFKDR